MAKRAERPSDPEKTMPLTGHLRELRNRTLVCVIVLVAVMVVCLGFSPQIVEALLSIGRVYGYKFIYVSPQELLLQYFSVSIIAALCLTLPVIFYEIWAFVRPGLKKGENVFFLLAMIFGLIFFVIGVVFALEIMLPFMLEFLISLNNSRYITASISVQNYLSFLLTIFVIFGIIFELPVVSVLLTQMGLMKVEWMRKGRRVAIVVIFLLAAIVTPPDIVSQVLVAVPMILLYQLSILLCSVFQRRKKRKQKEKDEDI